VRWVGFTLHFKLSASGCGGEEVMVMVEKLLVGWSSWRLRRRTTAMEAAIMVVKQMKKCDTEAKSE